MADTLAEYIARDRERLHGEREAVFTQQQELETKLAEINRELAAIDAYETAQSGKPASPARVPRAGGRRGTRRDGVLQVIKSGNGLTRGEILDKMGLRGNKTGEMSVSNALTALTKGNQVRRDGGKYHAA